MVELLGNVVKLVVMLGLELLLVIGHYCTPPGLLIHFRIKMTENGRRQEIEDRGAAWGELQAAVANLRDGQHEGLVCQLIMLIFIMGMEVNCNAEADLIDPLAQQAPGLIVGLIAEPGGPVTFKLAGVDVKLLLGDHDHHLYFLLSEISRSLDTRGQCKIERKMGIVLSRYGIIVIANNCASSVHA